MFRYCLSTCGLFRGRGEGKQLSEEVMMNVLRYMSGVLADYFKLIMLRPIGRQEAKYLWRHAPSGLTRSQWHVSREIYHHSQQL